MGRNVLRKLLASLMLTLAAGSPALANPDVWVTTSYLYRLKEGSVTGLAMDWEFDPVASSFLFDQVDTDMDGVVTAMEAQVMKTGVLGMLAEKNWHLHVMADGVPMPFSLESFEPVFEPDHLMLKFNVVFDEPVDYRSMEMITSLHDDETFFDFSFAPDDFLKVEGPFDPLCGFVVGPGQDLLDGHASTIALRCGEQP